MHKKAKYNILQKYEILLDTNTSFSYNASIIKNRGEKGSSMNLLGIVLRKFFHLIAAAFDWVIGLTKKRHRECTVIVSGGIALAVIILCASGFSGGGKNKVYAVESSAGSGSSVEGTADEEIGAGLMGIVDSMDCLEEYSRAVSSVNLDGAQDENVLAGTTRVRRQAAERIRLNRGIQDVSGLGYYAQQVIADNQMDKQDYEWLLKLVEAEATGGDVKSKILIANVVLNRVNDPHFPDSIYDVIFQTSGGAAQFSPTADGRIYSVEVTEETIEAVDRALQGEDYSEGALFFVARQSADDVNVQWFDSELIPLFSYGGHEFFTFEF